MEIDCVLTDMELGVRGAINKGGHDGVTWWRGYLGGMRDALEACEELTEEREEKLGTLYRKIVDSKI